MWTLRTRIFIAVSLIVLFILGISLLLILSRRAATPGPGAGTATPTGQIIDQSNFNAGSLNGTPAAGVPAGLPVKQATTVETEQNAARQLAKIFTERYGTYSTDNNGQNVREVKTLVTDDLWAKISAKLGVSSPSASFNGVTTRVVNSEMKNWDGGGAVVSLNTLRTEEKSGKINEYYQKITVTLVKSGENWLVNAFQWEK